MGVYTRFKKSDIGLRQLVELMELTPKVRRQKMIEVGMEEDREYTELALKYVMTFEDVMKLPDLELAEVLAGVPAQFIAYSIYAAKEEVKKRFIARATPKAVPEIKEYLEMPNISLSQIGSSQMKLIEMTRKLERDGLVKTKRIPVIDRPPF